MGSTPQEAVSWRLSLKTERQRRRCQISMSDITGMTPRFDLFPSLQDALADADPA